MQSIRELVLELTGSDDAKVRELLNQTHDFIAIMRETDRRTKALQGLTQSAVMTRVMY